MNDGQDMPVRIVVVLEFEYQGDTEEMRAAREQASRDRADSAINNLNAGSYSNVASSDQLQADAEEEDGGLSCAICFASFAKEDPVAQLSCRHIFHTACIRPWLERNMSCPTCRTAV